MEWFLTGTVWSWITTSTNLLVISVMVSAIVDGAFMVTSILSNVTYVSIGSSIHVLLFTENSTVYYTMLLVPLLSAIALQTTNRPIASTLGSTRAATSGTLV